MRCFAGPHRFVYILRCDSAKCHIFGGCAPRRGLWPPNLNSAEIFVQCVYPQVSSSYVYSFGSYRVDKQTHKQIPAKISNVLRYATTLGKYGFLIRSLYRCHWFSLIVDNIADSLIDWLNMCIINICNYIYIRFYSYYPAHQQSANAKAGIIFISVSLWVCQCNNWKTTDIM